MAAHLEGSVARRRAVAVVLYAAVASAVGLATWLLLAGEPRLAGAAAGVAGASLLLAGVNAHRVRSEPERALGAIADRLYDALLLSAIAWTSRAEDATAAAGALLALTAGFLAAYIRARSAALGYEVEESLATRGLRYAFVTGGLLAAAIGFAVWASAILGVVSSLVRASQVFKEERQ